MNPMFFADFYKTSHREQYPNGTTEVYSNFTPRKSRVEGVENIVFFGLQYIVKEYLIDRFNREFFSRDKAEVCNEYGQEIGLALNSNYDTSHLERLHDLGYLPIEIKALPEGSIVPLQTPVMTIRNTVPEFFWLTNYLETLISCEMWKPCTSATLAKKFRENFEEYAELTGASKEFIDWQGHDFSFRGMSSVDDACKSGAGHLLSFRGTDTIPSLMWLRKYYNAKGFIGGSVPATEHATQCANAGYDENISENEFSQYKRLITELYPNGIVSVVSDSYDFWGVVTDFLPRLKNEIMSRNGKLVIRPDSGTPHKILCGDPDANTEVEKKGLVRCLHETFGGTTNEKGFVTLDPHVGAIYGDSIDLREQRLILQGLMDNGFTTDNVVLGIGSYTYQYVTRDTFGFVCKATNCTVDGQDRAIFKNPKTGGWKKSHRGLLCVNEDMSVIQECSREQESKGLLTTVFNNGVLLVDQTFEEIRNKLTKQK